MAGNTSLDLHNKDGHFVRKDAVFRNWIEADGQFPPEANRYHLYVSLACPWANRCLAVMYMKGLEDVIGLSVVHPTWQKTREGQEHCGWVFANPTDPPLTSSTGHGSFDCAGCIPDTVNGSKFVRDLYEKAMDDPDYTGVYSVPVLWDKKQGTIVNNESSEILRIFNSAFNDLAKNPGLDLCPPALSEQIEAVNKWVYPDINNGVYKCGFARSQSAYEAAFSTLFGALDRVEDILGKQRYIAGDVLTEADIRLFMTLIRFDEVYVVYFKTNKKFIHQYPNMSNYVREIYQTPGVKESINMDHIKTHYFTSHPVLNHYAIIPVGGEPWWEVPHTRGK